MGNILIAKAHVETKSLLKLRMKCILQLTLAFHAIANRILTATCQPPSDLIVTELFCTRRLFSNYNVFARRSMMAGTSIKTIVVIGLHHIWWRMFRSHAALMAGGRINC